MTSPQTPAAEFGPVICVVGARPNFMKMAPILRAFAAHEPSIPALLVHTGQHYDHGMSHQLFEDLRLPTPDINLEVGSGSHAVQTAEVMRRFEPVIDQHRPSCVLVVGDVNSTLACALVASKKLQCRWCMWRPACAATTGACPRRSTACSPISSPIGSTPPSAAPAATCSARASPIRGCVSAAT
jgi:hypothetical protein